VKVVETGEHADEGVVGGLVGDVVEVVAAQVRERRATAGALEPRRAQEQGMQASDRLILRPAFRAQVAQPSARLVVEERGRRRRNRGRRVSRRLHSIRDCMGNGAHAATSSSNGATIRTASSGRQPRSTSSISACRS